MSLAKKRTLQTILVLLDQYLPVCRIREICHKWCEVYVHQRPVGPFEDGSLFGDFVPFGLGNDPGGSSTANRGLRTIVQSGA